jgi:hypothetical protein
MGKYVNMSKLKTGEEFDIGLNSYIYRIMMTDGRSYNKEIEDIVYRGMIITRDMNILYIDKYNLLSRSEIKIGNNIVLNTSNVVSIELVSLKKITKILKIIKKATWHNYVEYEII